MNYKCNYCDFECAGKVILNKHLNTKHESSIRKESESVQDFICRLNLEKYSNEYQYYFKENDFVKNKRNIEILVLTFGRDFIMDIGNCFKTSRGLR